MSRLSTVTSNPGCAVGDVVIGAVGLSAMVWWSMKTMVVVVVLKIDLDGAVRLSKP